MAQMIIMLRRDKNTGKQKHHRETRLRPGRAAYGARNSFTARSSRISLGKRDQRRGPWRDRPSSANRKAAARAAAEEPGSRRKKRAAKNRRDRLKSPARYAARPKNDGAFPFVQHAPPGHPPPTRSRRRHDFHVVRDHHDGHAFIPRLMVAEQVERCRRPSGRRGYRVGFVGEKAREGFMRSGPSDGGPPAVSPTGEFARPMLQTMRKGPLFAAVPRARAPPLIRTVSSTSRSSNCAMYAGHQHVVERREFRQQMVELKNEPEGAGCEVVSRSRAGRLSMRFVVEIDGAGVRCVEGAEEMEERAFLPEPEAPTMLRNSPVCTSRFKAGEHAHLHGMPLVRPSKDSSRLRSIVENPHYSETQGSHRVQAGRHG